MDKISCKNKVFVAAFLGILFLPLIFSDKEGGKRSADENRYLAAFPSLKWHTGIRGELENWMNDNAGGREQLKKIYDTVNISLLKTPRDSSYFYADDWMFTLNKSFLAFMQHSDVMDAEEQQAFVEAYENVQYALEDQGISFLTVIYPHKSEIYPEMFQGYIRPVNEESELDILEGIAQRNPQLPIQVTYDAFQEAKENGDLLYSKAYDGSHWNNQGAMLGYRLLMENIVCQMPEIRPLDETAFHITSIERRTERNGRIYSEQDLKYELKEPRAALDMTWFDSIQYQSEDMWHSYRYYKNRDGTLPKILLVGDSYIWMFMLPWISESFSETVFIHQLDVKNLQQMIDLEEPDLVVFAGLHHTVESTITQLSEEPLLR